MNEIKDADLDLGLETAYRNFMAKLQDDIQLHLGKDVPFMIRLDVKLGVEPKNENKIKVYEPKLSKLLNSMPTAIKPTEVTKTSEGK